MMFGIAGASLALAIAFLIATTAAGRTPTIVIVLSLLFALFALLSGILAFQLLLAKQRAIAGKDVSILFGLGRIVAWEQNEGLVFQRDKRVSDIVMGTEQGGGLRIIYPLIGEELKSRVPLSLQLTWFEDQRVLTREAVQLTVKIAMWWEICDLEKYCFQIENTVNSLDNSRKPGGHYGHIPLARRADKKGTAEVWIQTLAESCIRQLISETSTFLIVSKRASAGLPFDMVNGNALPEEQGDISQGGIGPATPDVIASSLKARLLPRVSDYGLSINRVEVQEVQLPPSIQNAVDNVWIASTQPKKSSYEAEALQNQLKALCDMLGPQATAMMKIVEKMPSGAYYGNPLGQIQSMLSHIKTSESGPSLGGALPVARKKKSRE
jgi:regulator of protease activity HflC (stomatin/prohibitin superfamily)